MTVPKTDIIEQTSPDTIVPKSITEVVEEKIKYMIVFGELELGQHITERHFSEIFNVSKTPIREAMLRLASEGLIDIKPRTGAFVFSLSNKQIFQITDLRRILESGALRSAIRHDAEGLRAALRRNVEDSEDVQGHDNPAARYHALDSRFHALFLEYADNPYLSRAYDVIACKVRAMRNRLTFPPGFIGSSLDQHKEVVRLLDEGHVGQAVTYLEYHISASFSNRARRLLSSTD